jgi:CRISPR/Cas system-associated protein endoribonuclease Cas2
MCSVVVYKRMFSCNHVDVPIFTLHHKNLFKKIRLKLRSCISLLNEKHIMHILRKKHSSLNNYNRRMNEHAEDQRSIVALVVGEEHGRV